MKLVVQRVGSASVMVDGETVGCIGPGLLVLVGVARDDSPEVAVKLAHKVCALRIFDDDQGVMNRSVMDAGGQILAVSQFTLLADTRRGHRPSYINAAPHELAIPLYDLFCDQCAQLTGKPAARGIFGADMKVALVNDGPVTIILDSNNPPSN